MAQPLRKELRRINLTSGDVNGVVVPGVDGQGVTDVEVIDGVVWVANTTDNTVTRVRVDP